ncbi:MAG: HAD family hydrolase [Bacteroidetes bacterium]|nr:HAD family hydrolase [Bacteroidota bacterium]
MSAVGMRGAVFLDRDGVINRERGEHTWRLEDFEVLPDVAPALRAIRAAGLLAIVISNQSGIALGLYTREEVEGLHAYLHHRLATEGAALDAVYYCPHHPQHGRCLCRKPGGLLLERAIARFGIDPGRSVMIGDRDRDVEAARSVGVKGILVAPNTALLPVLREQRII